jgi:hypothetical protein
MDARRLKRAQPLGPERQDFCRRQETLQRSENEPGACKYQAKYKHGGQRQCGRPPLESVNLIVVIGRNIARKKMQCSTSESTERNNKREQAPTPEVPTLAEARFQPRAPRSAASRTFGSQARASDGRPALLFPANAC